MSETVKVETCSCGGYGVLLSDRFERCHVAVSDVHAALILYGRDEPSEQTPEQHDKE